MDSKKILWLVGLVLVVGVGAAVLMTRPPAAPLAEAPASAAAQPGAETPAPAAATPPTETPACLQYSWDGAAWVCTSAPAAPGTTGSN